MQTHFATVAYMHSICRLQYHNTTGNTLVTYLSRETNLFTSVVTCRDYDGFNS